MGHEIEQFDSVVLHKEQAWHGLGRVVEEAPTPLEALTMAGLDYTIDRSTLQLSDGTMVRDHVANVRVLPNGEKEVMGIVSKDYKVVQNADLAQLCFDLAQEGDVVKIETAGSIRNGRKLWFLLKGESFSVRGKPGDELLPYICVSNGHDGKTAVRFTPTIIRVVCKNTLQQVIPFGEMESDIMKVRPQCYVAKHVGKLKDNLNEIRQALGLYQRSLTGTREAIDFLAAKQVDSDMVKRFFLECYTHDFGAIPDVISTGKEQNARERAMTAFNLFATRFDDERDLAGSTAWNMLNAYTGYVQHDRPVRIKDEQKRLETAAHNNLMGANADRTTSALKVALSLAG